MCALPLLSGFNSRWTCYLNILVLKASLLSLNYHEVLVMTYTVFMECIYFFLKFLL